MTDQASILIVDDDPVTRLMLTGSLERHGHHVAMAEDGPQALDLVRSKSVDVILLDVLMPQMDGYGVLEQLKGDADLRHIPVIMVTSVDDIDSAVRCIELGADDYLSKPIDPVLLAARINAGLTKKRLHDLEKEHLEQVAGLNERLEARVEEQMAELVRTGELKRFMPHQVAEGLLGGQLSASEEFERRRLTLLFADMVGFTDLSDALEPEELSQVLNEYLREMTAVAVSHGGTLDNYIGDGLMVMFGAPTWNEESVQAWAAIQAAFEMKARAEELTVSIRGRGIPADVRVRVGVNTGHCTVGVFGSDFLRAYKAVGFAVNVAARLQTEAEPGMVLVGFRTYALVKDRVRAEQREPLSLKGAARAVEAWEILDLVGGSARGM
ncbi:MAG: response regulator [Actinomycetota bacterium]|nr:response regulator [Actinomycetota bacterium]